MANAKQCDRCGNFYLNNTLHPTNGRRRECFVTGVATLSRDSSANKYIDLCDDCISDFWAFMNNEIDKIRSNNTDLS